MPGPLKIPALLLAVGACAALLVSCGGNGSSSLGPD